MQRNLQKMQIIRNSGILNSSQKFKSIPNKGSPLLEYQNGVQKGHQKETDIKQKIESLQHELKLPLATFIASSDEMQQIVDRLLKLIATKANRYAAVRTKEKKELQILIFIIFGNQFRQQKGLIFKIQEQLFLKEDLEEDYQIQFGFKQKSISKEGFLFMESKVTVLMNNLQFSSKLHLEIISQFHQQQQKSSYMYDNLRRNCDINFLLLHQIYKSRQTRSCNNILSQQLFGYQNNSKLLQKKCRNLNILQIKLNINLGNTQRYTINF